MRTKAAIAGLLLLLEIPSAVDAQPIDAKVAQRAIVDLESLRDADLRVASIAFVLATRGVHLCDLRQPQAGLLLQDLSQFRPDMRQAAAMMFNLGKGPAVEGIVPSSPAALAGFEAGDVLLDINGQSVASFLPVDTATRKSFDRAQALLDDLDDASTKGEVDVTVMRDGKVIGLRLAPRAGCVSRIQLVPSDHANADADGQVISISTALLREVANDDELAFVIAHEMAHNVLKHRVRLEREGVSLGLLGSLGSNAHKIRESEVEADYLAIYLMATSGFDPRSAEAFCARIEHERGLGFLADATHLNGARRQRFLSSVAREVMALQRDHLPLIPDMTKALSP